MKINRLFILAAVGLLPASASAVKPLWLRDVKIAPDGRTVAFQYKGAIWTVPVEGGHATRLTMMDGYQASPIWSPDSKKIAFQSDLHGNFDIFVMPAAGGKATRLTYSSVRETPEAFSPDGKSIYYSANIQTPARSAVFPGGVLGQLYAVPVSGGASRQVLGTPAGRVDFGGKDWFLYQDTKGFEDEWRKHHTSSVTRDIWRYDIGTGKHTNLTVRPGEDRDPVVDGDKVYFLSERDGGSMNVWVAPLSDMSKATAVTAFKTHPVRFLSASDNGLLCYAYDGEIYTQKAGGKPVRLPIEVREDNVGDTPEKMSVRSGARSATLSPDGKFVAFTHRGDVFVTSAEYNTTKRITSTPQGESSPVWSKDGKTLYYVSERDGLPNIWAATLGHDGDPDFANATVIDEKPLFKADKTDRRDPLVSPDGKKLAFIADRNRLCVMDLKSKNVRQLTDGSLNPSRTGGFYYTWSPDSKWIAFGINARNHDPYSDVALLNVDSGELINLTNSGYFSEQPRFALDGNAVIYATDRYGMRNHASWGSQMDVMMVFLNRDAFDKFRLSEEDYKIRKELEKKNKDKADKDSKKDDKKSDKKDESKADESKDIKVEKDGIENRVVRMTPISVDLGDAFVTSDGETLYYLISAQDGTQLWKINSRKNEHKMVAKAPGSRGFDITPDGKNVLLVGSSLKKFDTKSDKMTPVNFQSTMTVDHAAEREYMFDYVKREEGERFYNKGMHGIDWGAMTEHYRKFLPHINNNYDFAEMLSELLGELNASHTGGRYRAMGNGQADRTASLGLLYDMTYTGDGLRIDEVVVNGPFDRADSKVKAGDIVTAINGNEVKADQSADILLNDLAGKKTLVTFKGADGKTFSEVVLPVSAGAFDDLLYERWVRQRAADVDRWSGGRLGYVHIPSMADPAFRTVYSDVLGKYNDREGIVIDIRNNGGGRMHEDIEVMFSGKKYLTQEIRGVDVCDMPSRRWNKPSVMVTSEACYSNAHGTPWVYQHTGLGKVVGAPVPGTMTSVNWVTMQDPTMVFGIPAIGYRTAEGNYLENTELVPDVVVYNDPEVVVTGEDQQLHAAVKSLLEDLDRKRK